MDAARVNELRDMARRRQRPEFCEVSLGRWTCVVWDPDHPNELVIHCIEGGRDFWGSPVAVAEAIGQAKDPALVDLWNLVGPAILLAHDRLAYADRLARKGIEL